VESKVGNFFWLSLGRHAARIRLHATNSEILTKPNQLDLLSDNVWYPSLIAVPEPAIDSPGRYCRIFQQLLLFGNFWTADRDWKTPPDVVLKIVSVGDSGTGKVCILYSNVI
jgi:hypothetical protein